MCEEYGFADSTSNLRPSHDAKHVALRFATFHSDRIVAHELYVLLHFQKLIFNLQIYRASSSSAVTPRSSASRTESPSPSSSSARTPAASHGLFSSVASTARVSLRSVALPVGLLLNGVVESMADSNGYVNHEPEQEEGDYDIATPSTGTK